MKNTHVRNLKAEVPADIRLQVYKEALLYLVNEKWNVPDESEGDYGDGLCLILPCVLWGLFNYMSDGPEGDWCCRDTQKAFIEFERDKEAFYSHVNRKAARKSFLGKWIKELEESLK